jgi:hypothetical protein
MEQLISQIAESLGYPADMVERSAAARAVAEGVSTEDVLRRWAGDEAAPAAAPAAASAPATPAAPAAEAPSAPAEPSGPDVEVLAPAAEADAPTSADDEEAHDDDHEDGVRAAPAGSSVLAGFPRWLAAAFIIIPALAMLYLLRAPDGPDCGVSGQLALDPVTGVAENCDGTDYGVDVVNFFSVGQEIYDSRCASCHGAGGGGGAGQVLSGGAVLASFPEGQCTMHAEWIALGTANYPEATYGALAKPVGGFGQMPGFEGTLSEEEVASVALYERVAFGGQPLPDAEADCGLVAEGEMAAAP